MPIRVRGRVMNPRAVRLARRRRVAGRRGYKMKNLRNRPLAKYIRAVMRREEETKYVANQYDSALVPLANSWYSSGSLNAAADWYPALPALAQGTGDFQRIGAKVHPTSVSVSLKIGFNPQSVDAASLYGVIYYGVSKSIKDYQSNPIGAQQILDVGDGTNTTWIGLRERLNYPIDKNLYTMKRIVFRLTKTPGIQNSDLSGASVTGGNYSTANGLECRNFLLKFKAPKTLKYDNATDIWPTNFAPIYGVGFCHADGSALVAADAKLVLVNSHNHMYFKDA